jgi:hypothetical protein
MNQIIHFEHIKTTFQMLHIAFINIYIETHIKT